MADTLDEVLTTEEQDLFRFLMEQFEANLEAALLPLGATYKAAVLDHIISGTVVYGIDEGQIGAFDAHSDIDLIQLQTDRSLFEHPEGPWAIRRVYRTVLWQTTRFVTFRTGHPINIHPATVGDLARVRDYQPYAGFSLRTGDRIDFDAYGNGIWPAQADS